MKRFYFLLLSISIIALLAACGGGDDTSSSSNSSSNNNTTDTPVTEPEPVADETVALTFEGSDIAFDITAATVPAGAEVEVTLDNVGALEHSWVLMNVEDYDPTDQDLNSKIIDDINSGVVPGGESHTFSFTAPEEPGTYKYVCTVPGHAALMAGDLTVE
ncbi:MAG TPA: plastocyanin/azurin family copper-binding protein [Anaerolineae bacterium]|nr:plastocyanin/azurin family copper-binding protein [Anaerolineae bacterium]